MMDKIVGKSIGLAVLVIVALLFLEMTSGCAVAPDKFIVGIDHTSHLLQHFEHEGDGQQVGCTGPMIGLRWQGAHYYVQASDMYCAQGNNDLQREVANLQAGYSVDLK